MKEYLLLFRGGDASRFNMQKNPAEWEAHMMKWKTWMENLGRQGKFISGQPLAQTGTVITGTNKKLTDGPFAEGKEIVGGYMMIRANDLTEAIKLSNSCPILEHDGIVEVREIQQLNM